MPARRDLSLEEMAVVAELATATPDLVGARGRLLAALDGPQLPAGETPGLRPTTWKELLDAVRLGVVLPREAARFVDVPQPKGAGSMFRRAVRLRWQHG